MTGIAIRSNWSGVRRAALACLLLMTWAAVPVFAQSYLDLYNFDCSAAGGGCTPEGALIQGTDSYLYGTTTGGGANGLGTIFKVSTTGSGYTVLWNFDSSTGISTGGLTLSSFDGNLYGTTGNTLFRFVVSTQSLTVLHVFSSLEGFPAGPPVEDTNRNLFGVTSPGKAYVWKVGTSTYTLLKGKIPVTPAGPLYLASDKNLYGASLSGGANDAGAVFSITSGGKTSLVYSFTGLDDGQTPNAPLVEGKDGQLYTTAGSGGFFSGGTIVSLTLPTPTMPSSETTQREFDENGSDPYEPQTGLLAASDGNFYSTTIHGGADNLGTIFQLQPGGSFFEYVDFSGTTGADPGANPNANLMEHTNGTFYGVTPTGGTNGSGDGVLFSFTPPNPSNHVSLCCNWWVFLDQPVTILGSGFRGAINVMFGGAAAQFRVGSDTFLTARVPSGAIDAPITVTMATGGQVLSAQSVHVLPKITSLDPTGGPVGTVVNIVGGGFAGTTKVTFGGVAASNFTVISPSLIQATVPSGAVTGKVVVTTPNGSATSKQTFTVS